MRVLAVGERAFVAGFRLAGVSGLEVEDANQALRLVTKMTTEKNLAIILLSEQVAKPIRSRLNEVRAKKPLPLIYELPSPGSKQEKIEYRGMLKQILGVGT